MTVEMLKEESYIVPITIKVTRETKQRLVDLKTQRRINTPAELRKAIERLVTELEKAKV